MPPRAVLNMVFAHVLSGVQSEEDRDKFIDQLYEPIGGSPKALSLLEQIGG